MGSIQGESADVSRYSCWIRICQKMQLCVRVGRPWGGVCQLCWSLCLAPRQ